ncbi:hypothetical protein O181_052100 [Austropuccinia psidii MF-1]|uniref:Uncharacterized protein n=1 Tax=Austropuccinia psidii MF-1 TaxID=1389203 RepID=A0A9Q3DY97_9BASI|nr:hypothetical protein [Austropuccinia psidii MF-1]
MIYSIKFILFFLLIIGQLPIGVRLSLMAKLGKLGRSSKAGGEAAGAGGTGSRAGDGIKGGDGLGRAHINPKGAGGPQRINPEVAGPSRLPTTAPRVRLPAAPSTIPLADRAGAITPEIESKAESYLQTFLPSLYRRIKQFVVRLNFRKDSNAQSIEKFKMNFHQQSDVNKEYVLSKAFESLRDNVPRRSLEDLQAWVNAIKETFTKVPPPGVEIRLHMELSEYLTKATKLEVTSPLYHAVPDFKKLQIFLYDRAQPFYDHWVPLGKESRGWRREFLNFDKNVLESRELESDTLHKIQSNPVSIEPFMKIQKLPDDDYKRVAQSVKEIIAKVQDDTLAWVSYRRVLKGEFNKYELDDRTASATSLLYLYQTAVRALQATPRSLKNKAIVRTIEETFKDYANKEPFLYPHFMKLHEAIRKAAPLRAAARAKTRPPTQNTPS